MHIELSGKFSKNIANMEHKETYKSPQTEVFEVKTEGVICASGESLRGGNYPEWNEDII